MADVNVTGTLICADGTIIPLLDADMAEGTEEPLSTNSAYTVSVSAIGDYAPGKVVVAASIEGDHSISYAYILRQGLIATILPVSVKGVSGSGPMPLCAPFQVQPGDIVRVLVVTAAARTASVCVYTNRGVYRIFTIASASGNVQPVDLQTGNGLGDTLQGQVIMKAFCTSGSLANSEKISSGGVLALNEKGMPVGLVPTNSPQLSAVNWSDVRIPVALNYQWRITSTS
jgi:hypothetical protein|tara:strand:- start:460 stop:1146 length:687 start_codon:yes stop_codon:yes gene_type:complete